MSATLRDTYNIIARALTWDGSTPALDAVCDDLVLAADDLQEHDAARIGIALLLVDGKRLPALQDAICEYCAAKVHREDSFARSHLVHSHQLLFGIERQSAVLWSQYGVNDVRLPALRARIELLQGDLDQGLPRFRELLMQPRSSPPPADNQNTVDLTLSDDGPSIQPEDSKRIESVGANAMSGQQLALRPGASTIRGSEERAAKRKRTEKQSSTASGAAAPKKDVPTEPVSKPTSSQGPRPTSTPTKPAPAKPTKIEPSSSEATDSVKIEYFAAISSSLVSGGHLTYDSDDNTIAVLDTVAYKAQKLKLGRREIVKVFWNAISLRVYITGAKTAVSSGRMLIIFKDQAGMLWFLEKAKLVSDQATTVSILTERLNAIFANQSIAIRNEREAMETQQAAFATG